MQYYVIFPLHISHKYVKLCTQKKKGLQKLWHPCVGGRVFPSEEKHSSDEQKTTAEHQKP